MKAWEEAKKTARRQLESRGSWSVNSSVEISGDSGVGYSRGASPHSFCVCIMTAELINITETKVYFGA
jgi:hypothetical protein